MMKYLRVVLFYDRALTIAAPIGFALAGFCPVMNLPSITGTAVKVPKKPERPIATFAACRLTASTSTRHSNVSVAFTQLRFYQSKPFEAVKQIKIPC